MFNLIISIIAIALVVVLAGASLYYGGSAFNQGSSDAKAATLINQAQQIQASVTLYKANEGGAPESIGDLDGQYLAATPEIPVGAGTDAWVLDTAGTLGGSGSKDIVAVKVNAASKADEGITKDICKTINADGAGVVFCTMDAADVTTVDKTKGSTDAAIDGLALVANTSKAVVHMAL
ncbi:hypothetical protein [Vibrio owensii]|uniref:hypothetical protein n=2 Tax=Vibrio harveyi group TaxID=717610 RepID=UPI003CC68AD4